MHRAGGKGKGKEVTQNEVQVLGMKEDVLTNPLKACENEWNATQHLLSSPAR